MQRISRLSTARSVRAKRTRRRPIQKRGAIAKGPFKEAKFCFIGHALMEDRHALFVDACLTPAEATPSASPRCTCSSHAPIARTHIFAAVSEMEVPRRTH